MRFCEKEVAIQVNKKPIFVLSDGELVCSFLAQQLSKILENSSSFPNFEIQTNWLGEISHSIRLEYSRYIPISALRRPRWRFNHVLFGGGNIVDEQDVVMATDENVSQQRHVASAFSMQ